MKDKKVLILALILGLIFTFVTAGALFAGGNKALQNQLNECNGKVKNLESENGNLKSQISDLQNQISSLKSDKQQLEQKINNLQAQIAQKDKEIADLKSKIEAPEPTIVSKTVEKQIQEKNQQIQALQLKKQKLEQNVQKINQQLAQLQQNLQSANQQLAQLQQENQALRSQTSQLQQNNQSLKSQTSQLQQKNSLLESEKKALEEKVTEISKEKEADEKALAVYEGIQKRTQEMMNLALEKIKSVLKEEIDKGEVRVFKGTMGIVIDVKGKPMFDEGSVKLNPKGQYIIGKIGLLLEELNGYMVGVIGNADSKPIVTPSLKKCYPTNWELSAQRGATVVRYIIKHSTVPPTRMVAMGLGQFQPIDTNDTPEGRGNNRRVDLVLLPMDVLSSVVIGAEIK